MTEPRGETKTEMTCVCVAISLSQNLYPVSQYSSVNVPLTEFKSNDKAKDYLLNIEIT